MIKNNDFILKTQSDKNKKNILIITPHFWPENFIINDIAEEFSNLNVNVNILTGLPNYPRGEIYKGYKKIKKITEQKHKKINILRFPIIPRKRGGLINLILNYTSFIVSGFLNIRNYNFKTNIDNILIYGVSPITTCLLGIFLKAKYKIKLTLWIQDLWPESVKYTGFIKNKFLIYLITILVKYIYSNCDNLIAQSNSFKKNIRKFSNKKIYTVENCYLKSKKFKKKISGNLDTILKKNYCLAFAGNIGKAQSIKTILDAANKIKKLEKVKILIIGEGSEYLNNKRYAEKNRLNNVIFLGHRNSHETYSILKKCKGLILTLKKSEIFSLTVPLKFATYVSIGLPILISADGEVSRLTKINKIGFCGPSENSTALVKNIKNLLKKKKQYYKQVRFNSKILFKKSFDLKLQSRKLLNIIYK